MRDNNIVMKKIVSLFVLILMSLPVMVFAAGKELKNDVLKMKVDIVGHLSLWTTGGDPSLPYDNNKDLLNNKSFGSTYILVSVNGQVARMGSSKGKNIQFTSIRNGAIVSSWEFRGILFTQKVKFYKGYYSNKKSLAKVNIRVNNKSGKTALIGIRAVVDPMLGPSDSRPFFVPGRGAVSSGTLLKNKGDIPSIIYTCHRPTKGSGDFVLNLYGADLVRPDKIYFATDAYLANDTVFDPGSRGKLPGSLSGKSAIGLVWNPKEFKSGESDGIAFGLGIAVHSRKERSPLNILITNPVNTSNEEFWVGVVIENDDKFWDISNLAVTLKYSGTLLRLEKGSMIYTFKNLPRRGMVFIYWKFRVLKSGQVGFTFNVSGTYRSRALSKSFQVMSVLTKK